MMEDDWDFSVPTSTSCDIGDPIESSRDNANNATYTSPIQELAASVVQSVTDFALPWSNNDDGSLCNKARKNLECREGNNSFISDATYFVKMTANYTMQQQQDTEQEDEVSHDSPPSVIYTPPRNQGSQDDELPELERMSPDSTSPEEEDEETREEEHSVESTPPPAPSHPPPRITADADDEKSGDDSDSGLPMPPPPPPIRLVKNHRQQRHETETRNLADNVRRDVSIMDPPLNIVNEEESIDSESSGLPIPPPPPLPFATNQQRHETESPNPVDTMRRDVSIRDTAPSPPPSRAPPKTITVGDGDSMYSDSSGLPVPPPPPRPLHVAESKTRERNVHNQALPRHVTFKDDVAPPSPLSDSPPRDSTDTLDNAKSFDSDSSGLPVPPPPLGQQRHEVRHFVQDIRRDVSVMDLPLRNTTNLGLKKKSSRRKKSQKRVQFAQPVVTDIKLRPISTREEKKRLFFTWEELTRLAMERAWEETEIITLDQRQSLGVGNGEI